MAGTVYTWAGWTFEPDEWRLTSAAGAPVALPNRTLELLALLLERAPSLVTKDDILTQVWRDSVVEEGNIAFHIASLRKALDAEGSSCIETVRGRGYRFAAPVTRRTPAGAPPSARMRRPSRVPAWAVAGLLGLIGGVGWLAIRDQAPPIRAVTVLPTTTGLAELVAARLASETTLRTSIGTPGHDNESPGEAGQRLGAEAILTVTLDQTQDPWLVVAAITRTRDRARLWNWMFAVESGSPATAHAVIAGRVATGLGRHLGLTRAGLPRRPVDPAAYDVYLQAREQWRQRTPHSVQQAIRLYERAIAIDPEFSRAYAGLADCYNLTMSGLPPEVRYPRALEYAEKAVALDPNDAAGHTSLAFLRYKFEWRWEEADAEFRRAIALDPGYALAHHWYGEFLSIMGRYDEAIAHLRQGIVLEPESLAIQSDLVPPLIRSGRVAEARAVVEAAAAANPNWHFIPYRTADVLEAEGRERDAVESRWRWMLLSGTSLETVDRLRAAYAAGGMAAMARVEIEGHLATEQATPGAWLTATHLSRLYGRVGEHEEALRWLHIAIDRREDAVLTLLSNADYDSLRGQPEFDRAVARAGLTPR